MIWKVQAPSNLRYHYEKLNLQCKGLIVFWAICESKKVQKKRRVEITRWGFDLETEFVMLNSFVAKSRGVIDDTSFEEVDRLLLWKKMCKIEFSPQFDLSGRFQILSWKSAKPEIFSCKSPETDGVSWKHQNRDFDFNVLENTKTEICVGKHENWDFGRFWKFLKESQRLVSGSGHTYSGHE